MLQVLKIVQIGSLYSQIFARLPLAVQAELWNSEMWCNETSFGFSSY